MMYHRNSKEHYSDIRLVQRFVVVLCASLWIGCGSADDPAVGGALDTFVADIPNNSGIELPNLDGNDGADGTDGATQSDGADGTDGEDGASGEDGDDSVAPVDCEANPSSDTCPCNEHAECDSGYCLLTSNGKACAAFCSQTCPSGYSCQGVGQAGAGADLSFLCVQRAVFLCRPCLANSDCAAMGFEGLDKCVDYGDQGSFCGIACNLENPCPLGFECDGGQCVAAGGTCKCAPLHISLEASTECAVSSDLGSCTGKRKCSPSGLTECSAVEPQAEVCDGKDNNCSGFIDDVPPTDCELPNEYGVCKGTLVCANGVGECQGVEAAPETCDGKDNDCNGTVDDGYPDNDGDKLTDCVDPDDDNDGLVDEIDNCPIHPNPDQSDTDGDKEGDACDQDDDNDGTLDTKDCEPKLAFVYPFAKEVCDGLDNDCDGATDEKSCDDGNQCTDDVCKPTSGCEFPYNVAPCNDGNQCTKDDACKLGACDGQFVDCDDGNSCTNDSCDAKLGCVKVNNVVPCDDGNACSINDSCAGGVCVAGALMKCEDGNNCTLDGCDPQLGCKFSFLDNPCDDGNACTVSDKCTNGTCVGLEKLCDDANPCTKDYCSPAVDGGCVNLNTTGGDCEDGLPCTINDKCVSGVCQGIDVGCECNTDKDCNDDGNLCNGTVYCDKLSVPFQCKNKPGSQVNCELSGQYDEGCASSVCDPKTGQCNAKLSPTGKKCDDGDACTGSDACEEGVCTGTNKDCDDGNPCTIDVCDENKGCQYAVIGGVKSCDDGDPCTAGDTCEFGFCTGKGKTDCDDGNPCTDDSCDGATGCKHKANTKPCLDNDLCTENEQCFGGKCVGSAVTCTDNNKCFESPSCDPSKGCVKGKAIDCDDSLACTLDKCLSGSGCQNLPNNSLCDDGEFCNGLEKCILGKGCLANAKPDGTNCDDGNLCTVGDVCAAGTCSGEAKNCDDGNECTHDSCDGNNQGCLNKVITGVKFCDDKNECTKLDQCKAGFCVGGVANDCDDGNPCTKDSCDPVKGCINTPTAAVCDDGDSCTLNDTCSQGKCVGQVLDCSNNGDGDACTTNDKCVNGQCVGTPKDCSSLDSACTQGECAAGDCVATPVSGDCDDGDSCTSDDACDAGQCVGTAKDCSALDEQCAAGLCQAGQCIKVEQPCNVTQFRFISPSVSLMTSAGGQIGVQGAGGQPGPNGKSANNSGHNVIWGFFGAASN